MSFKLIESVKEVLYGDMANRMAGIFGEKTSDSDDSPGDKDMLISISEYRSNCLII